MKTTRSAKKPINPAIAWGVILGVIILAVVLYMTVGKRAGSTGDETTAAKVKYARELQQQMEKGGIPVPGKGATNAGVPMSGVPRSRPSPR